MTVTQKTVLKIECDNPNCPGTNLPDAKSYDHWYRVNVTTQESPATLTPLPGGAQPQPFVMPISTGEKVYCSPSCVTSIEQTLVEEQEAREAAKNPPMPDKLPDAS